MVKDDFFWLGGRLWVDAVNSEGADTSGTRVEFWSEPARLQAWLHFASEHHAQAQALRDFSGVTEELLLEAKRLRAVLRRACEVAHASANSQDVAPELVEAINAALGFRGVRTQLEWNEDGWRERELSSGESSDALYLLARSAARSWASGELVRLKPCANPLCILWFLDTSKNGTRRWCSMQGCGNRHKVTAHYARHSVEKSEPPKK